MLLVRKGSWGFLLTNPLRSFPQTLFILQFSRRIKGGFILRKSFLGEFLYACPFVDSTKASYYNEKRPMQTPTMRGMEKPSGLSEDTEPSATKARHLSLNFACSRDLNTSLSYTITLPTPPLSRPLTPGKGRQRQADLEASQR